MTEVGADPLLDPPVGSGVVTVENVLSGQYVVVKVCVVVTPSVTQVVVPVDVIVVLPLVDDVGSELVVVEAEVEAEDEAETETEIETELALDEADVDVALALVEDSV
jgi:hypothetical protein